MPDTIAADPNRMKQPMITVAPTRQLSRPVSIMKPTIATAMTATDVAEQGPLQPAERRHDRARPLRIGLRECR